MGTTENKTLCYKRNQEVTFDEYHVVVCQKCEIITSGDQCKVTNKVSCIIKVGI